MNSFKLNGIIKKLINCFNRGKKKLKNIYKIVINY